MNDLVYCSSLSRIIFKNNGSVGYPFLMDSIMALSVSRHLFDAGASPVVSSLSELPRVIDCWVPSSFSGLRPLVVGWGIGSWWLGSCFFQISGEARSWTLTSSWSLASCKCLLRHASIACIARISTTFSTTSSYRVAGRSSPVVLESPVQSGLLPIFGETKTETGL